jgi:hypothetical protein
MMLIKKYVGLMIGAVIGGVAGYAYYYWIGCASGSCAITSQPVNSTLYGALMGGLMVNIFNKK